MSPWPIHQRRWHIVLRCTLWGPLGLLFFVSFQNFCHVHCTQVSDSGPLGLLFYLIIRKGCKILQIFSAYFFIILFFSDFVSYGHNSIPHCHSAILRMVVNVTASRVVRQGERGLEGRATVRCWFNWGKS